MGIQNIIALLSGIAMFLFGMTLMGEGLKKVAGNRLELVLFQLSNTPLKGLLLGTGVTAIIQSSSATSVMVVGFVNSGMMKVRQAIGIVMGAIIGTSITGWIISLSYIGGESTGWLELLSTATITGVIAVIGIFLRMFCKKPTQNHIGDILMGFAVLMLGMQSMSGAVAPLKESEEFIKILTSFSAPLLGILVGTAFTSILQSASAAVGILQALSVTGAIDFSVALPILMGIAIGAAVPVLLSALGANTAGKRTALVYLVVEVVGVVIWAVLFYGLHALLHFEFVNMTMTPVSIALLNTLFRLIKVVVLLPAISLIEKVVSALVPERKAGEKKNDLNFMLEDRFIQHPALAVEQSRLTINSMASEARVNLLDAFSLMEDYSREGYDRVQRREGRIDRYEDALGTYLVKITGNELTAQQNKNISKYLHTLSDFERLSDHAVNIAATAQELSQKGIRFSEEATREMKVLFAAVSEVLWLSVDAFIQNDLQRAAQVEPLEERIDELCEQIKLNHVERLQKGKCTLSVGFILNDLLTDLERAADHCSNIAAAIIELESDAFDTHEYLSQVKKLRSQTFTKYFEEYSQKYSL